MQNSHAVVGNSTVLGMPLRRATVGPPNADGVQHQVEVPLHRALCAGVVLIERDRDLGMVNPTVQNVQVGVEERRAIRIEVAEELAAIHLDLRIVSDEQGVVGAVNNIIVGVACQS